MLKMQSHLMLSDDVFEDGVCFYGKRQFTVVFSIVFVFITIMMDDGCYVVVLLSFKLSSMLLKFIHDVSICETKSDLLQTLFVLWIRRHYEYLIFTIQFCPFIYVGTYCCHNVYYV